MPRSNPSTLHDSQPTFEPLEPRVLLADVWYNNALAHDTSPVDLSYLNDDYAGEHGFLQAEGDTLVFDDGTEARFWGGNIAASAIYDTEAHIVEQTERMAQLGYNLMRIHHHDSMGWVDRPVIDKGYSDSQHLDPDVMDRLDWWIKCMKDNGVYVWLDLHVGRVFKSGDGISIGWDEISRRGGNVKGFDYFNGDVEALMQEFNEAYLNHVNPYTGLAYKDDPGIICVLLTNEDDLTANGANVMLGDKGNPVHNALMTSAMQDFCAETGLSYSSVYQTWRAGASKLFTNDAEHDWDARMIDHLRDTVGYDGLVATTDLWHSELFSLPALTTGDVIDVHSYGSDGALATNPRTSANYLSRIASGQVYDMPVTVTEWNVPFDNADRFTSPVYTATMAAFQGWDAMMIYNYSQRDFYAQSSATTWSSFHDPAITGVAPLAALLYRAGHVSDAINTYCLQLNESNLYYQATSASSSQTIRTLMETSKLTIGLPNVSSLDWDTQTTVDPGVQVVTSLSTDYIPSGQDYVESDTGEIKRDWSRELLTIDTDKSQAAVGRVGAAPVQLGDVYIDVSNTEGTIGVSSLDDQPIISSNNMLLTAVSTVTTTSGSTLPWRSLAVDGTIRIRSNLDALKLVPLSADGTRLAPVPLSKTGDEYVINLPAPTGTHWFLVQAVLPGDVNSDGTVNAADIDTVYANLGDPAYDLDGDGDADNADVHYLVEEILGTHMGDANLDGAVADSDYTLWADHYLESGVGWADGDFTGNGVVTEADYTIWADNYTGAAAAAGAVESLVGAPGDVVVAPAAVEAPIPVPPAPSRPAMGPRQWRSTAPAAEGYVDVLTLVGEYTLADDAVSGAAAAGSLSDALEPLGADLFRVV
jgi:hypothetical protein